MKPYAVWWDLQRNTVLISEPWKQEAGLAKIILRWDSRLATGYEKRLVARLVEEMFGKPLPVENKVMLLHRIPAETYAFEVFYDGVRLGVVEYNARRLAWILHPSAALAWIMVDLGVPVVFEAEASGRVKGKHLASDQYRVLGSPRAGWGIVRVGGSIGVARLRENGSLKIKDVTRSRIRFLGASQDPVEANRPFIEEIAGEASSFIRRRLGSRSPVYVMLSGGMDSAAAAVLASESLGPRVFRAVYLDTGIGFRDAYMYVSRLADRLGLELIVLEAGENRYWNELRRRGLNTRGNRWCTDVLKLDPVRRFTGGRRHHVVEGVRAYESHARARAPRVRENPLVPGQIQYFPILYWPRLYVQLFLASRQISPNPLYEKGLERIGCVVCPAMHLHELVAARLIEPAVHGRFVEELAGMIGADKECVEKALYSEEWKRISRNGEEELRRICGRPARL